ncbi:hypothetical protein Y032_0061g3294 [Ancylostoma ceylanicum]|uniref:Uncharacterized protein n=1 Tax=Ancylostoma ceylanicum TaxID=53326 RepID=A0A016U3Z8_9BILA|nr:hypothetical protein Y032_0061g3294 [Ancylostoma ceylanicum]
MWIVEHSFVVYSLEEFIRRPIKISEFPFAGFILLMSVKLQLSTTTDHMKNQENFCCISRPNSCDNSLLENGPELG